MSDYRRYSIELFSEMVHFFNQAVLAPNGNKDFAKGQLIIRLYQLIAALEERPFSTEVLRAHTNSQSDGFSSRETSPARSTPNL